VKQHLRVPISRTHILTLDYDTHRHNFKLFCLIITAETT